MNRKNTAATGKLIKALYGSYANNLPATYGPKLLANEKGKL